MTDLLPPCERMVLLTEGASVAAKAKTAISLLRYRGDDVVAVLDSHKAGLTTGEVLGVGGETPIVGSLSDVAEPDSLVGGTATPGGRIPDEWRSIFADAIKRGLDIVNGLHDFVSTDPQFALLAEQHGVRLVDVRRNNERETAGAVQFDRNCVRIHTVGNDCSVGKMVTALEIQRGLSDRGHNAGFAATGQTGIMISGNGIPIDCVVADFVNGAAERLVQHNQNHEFLLIEGQASIINPRFSAVTVGLLHGVAPDGLILCCEVGRPHMKGLEHVPSMPIENMRSLVEELASTRHPCRAIGVSMNSRYVTESQAEDERERLRDLLQLPVCDVYRHTADELVEAAIQLRQELVS